MIDINKPEHRIKGSRALIEKVSATPDGNGGIDLEGHIQILQDIKDKALVFVPEVCKSYVSPEEVERLDAHFDDPILMGVYIKQRFLEEIGKLFPGEVPYQKKVKDPIMY